MGNWNDDANPAAAQQNELLDQEISANSASVAEQRSALRDQQMELLHESGGMEWTGDTLGGYAARKQAEAKEAAENTADRTFRTLPIIGEGHSMKDAQTSAGKSVASQRS